MEVTISTTISCDPIDEERSFVMSYQGMEKIDDWSRIGRNANYERKSAFCKSSATTLNLLVHVIKKEFLAMLKSSSGVLLVIEKLMIITCFNESTDPMF
ncbi:hypothetical protein AVEN_159213-1 [Araneus ventricosus]|uniref:Uncharacterized protein n=1 Tax=Araneus ventricosus TaxID=182803 RepID=A0A4Y2A161_ARAVE|nr:hypothetical protein AVEN_159213-1 [Araneus ventricosus]